MPTLADVPMFVSSGTSDTSTLTSSSFTPGDGEVLVVKLATSHPTNVMGAPSGGSLTWGSAWVSRAPGGFRGSCSIYAVKVGTSPGSMTVSSTPSGACWHSMVVERWSNADLATTPATGSNDSNTGAANSSLTSTGSNSIVSSVSVDVQSLDPASRAYLGSATEDGLMDAHGSSNGVHYHAWQAAASAGTQNFGLSAPTGMQYVIAGIEVLDIPVTWTFGYDVVIG
jgi:hypothetical protein